MEAESSDDEAVCYLRGVHMSPYKVRRVLDVIRGKSYEECLIMLEFMPYRACGPCSTRSSPPPPTRRTTSG